MPANMVSCAGSGPDLFHGFPAAGGSDDDDSILEPVASLKMSPKGSGPVGFEFCNFSKSSLYIPGFTSSPVVSPKISLLTPKPLVIQAGLLFRPRRSAPESPEGASLNCRSQDLPSAGSDAAGASGAAGDPFPPPYPPLPPIGGRTSLRREGDRRLRDGERRLREGLRRLREGERLLDRDRRCLRERDRLPLERLERERERLRLEAERLRLEADRRPRDFDFLLDLDLFFDLDFERLSLSASSFSLPSPSLFVSPAFPSESLDPFASVTPVEVADPAGAAALAALWVDP